MRSRFVWLMAVALWAGAAAPALAQQEEGPSASESESARDKFIKGQRAYQQGDYDRAIEAWKAAYELDPRPLILYNLSQAYERYGRLPEAVDALERYLAEADARDPNLDVARARLSTLKERLNKTSILVADAPEGAEIFVDGESWGGAPRPDPIPVSPGNHKVVLKLEGYRDFRSSVGVPAGQRIEVSAEMEPRTAEAGAAVERKAGLGPYIVAGVGAAMVIGAAITGGLAMKKAKDAEFANRSDADSAETMALTADILGGVGGAAIAGGVIWWFLAGGFGDGGGEEAEEEAVSFTPTFGPGGAGASATVRF